jgi:prevent-host-death family protein
MGEIVGIAEAKNDLSELVNRAAYGGERIVLGSRGKPKAAIVSLADLRLLQAIEQESAQNATPNQVEMFDTRPTWTADAQMQVLEKAADLRAAMRKRRGGQPLPDSVPLIRQIRRERAL